MSRQWWNKKQLATVLRPSYIQLRYLGNGLNGVVFRALRQSDKKMVAVKFVRLSSKDRITRSRLDLEVQAMERLGGRRAIEIIEKNLTTNPPYYVMEFLPLGDLRKSLKISRSTESLLFLLLEIAQCIKLCHDGDITHRDIKPENILFRRKASPILSDFGICKLGTGGVGTTVLEMQRRGTPLYMAPEIQHDSSKPHKPADIYSFGIMLHYDFLPLINHSETKERLAKLASRCTPVAADHRPTIDIVIRELEEARREFESYLLKLKRIRWTQRLVLRQIDRVRHQDLDLLGDESKYLDDRIEEFNRLAIYTDEYKSDTWQKRMGYSHPSVSTSKPGQAALLREARRFSRHAIRYLNALRQEETSNGEPEEEL